MKRIFNFSGGKTSAYMTIKYYQKGDLVIFCDTGREHPKTYKFINDFEANENIPIIRISYKNSENPFRKMLEHQKNMAIPNMTKRFCTIELKIKTAKRYLRAIGIRNFENFIGFRFDEERRVLKRKKIFVNVIDKFPLFEDKINKYDINEYWKTKTYKLEIPSILGNCTLCFMKGKNAIISILSQYPELADEWIEDEELSKKGRTYFPNITIKELRDIAQHNLFTVDLDKISPSFNCNCTS